ncbi:protein cramped [Leguminivora glycinivorella]|uniref:protein cramped n=1 Tax=Leguminivora glycinivorella TaxID=1035111 RepID=UPI0020109AB4|nr:protein cramped [Leguminivora glycinivorella]
MPNKDPSRSQVAEIKVVPVVQNVTPSKTAAGAVAAKTSVAKATTKDSAMSPGAAPAAHDSSELLGSLTTQQQQRTSARVIKKLRTEPVPDPDKRDIPECDTPSKIDEKELKFPTVKQRMPKALWSADEKSLFFEALNEYGKDFDAITTHVCAKMKKKGMPDVNLKTKTQVSHFYYRTWHKLSKHVHFGENVKKVAQELYALINYGELRKKLVSVSEKTCARLHEMVLSGSMVVRHRGRNVRVRTPMCRALRRLNQITERSPLVGVCALASVSVRARSAGAWARVQAAAHNPRACVQLSPRTKLAALLRALEKRWQGKVKRYKPKLENIVEMEAEEPEPPRAEDNEDNLEDHLNLEPDRIIVQEQKLAKRPVLHLGPRPTATVRLPVVRASEQLSSQKICFSSYLQRMYSQDKEATKIRTAKRHRKDSSEKDKELEKRPRLESEPKLDIDETAVDGIELMANYKTNQEDEEKPSTEDEKEIKSEETAEEEVDKEERDKYMSEREKDSFSEMEDDEKYIKSDSDNESDKDKGEKKTKFKNLKVKFRIRPKKCGGPIYTLVNEDEPKTEEVKEEDPPDIDVDSAVKQIRKGWSVYDAGELTIGDLYLMFGARSKLDLDYWWAEPTPPLPKKELDKTPPQEKRPDRASDKGTDSSLEDERERRESDSDLFSPKASGQDSNDGSGDERKPELLVSSPERKPSLSSLNLASKLVNRPSPAPSDDGFSQVSERLKRLLALAGNPHVGGALARCSCGHVCSQRKHPPKPPLLQPPSPRPEPVFRHPTPIAPKPANEAPLSMSLSDLPRWRRGRPRAADRRVVVQRLLPLLPKLPPPSNLIPVKIVPNSPSVPPRILPKPPPTSTNDLSMFYVLSESNGQFFFHDGDRRIPISAQDDNEEAEEDIQDESYDSKEDTKEFKIDITSTEVEKRVSKPDDNEASEPGEPNQPSHPSESSQSDKQKPEGDIANFLPSESMSLSPSRCWQATGGSRGLTTSASARSWVSWNRRLQNRWSPTCSPSWRSPASTTWLNLRI